MFRRDSGRPLALVVLAFWILGGCGPSEKLPKTYPVKGKVVLKGGNVRQLVGGYVRLELVSDPKVTAVGEIEEDGTFALGSFLDGKAVGGVLPGAYRARVELPADEESGRSAKGIIDPRFQSFDKSGLKYTVDPRDNEMTIEVTRPGR